MAAGLAIVMAVTAAAILWPAISAIPFWDDLYTILAVDITAARGRPSFLATSDVIAFWRPLELFFNSALKNIDPVTFVPVKLLSLASHAVKAVAVAVLVGRLVKAPAVAVALAGAAAMFHPAAVSAAVQIDTLSEGFAAAAIVWALVLVLDAVEMDDAPRRRRLAGVAVLCAVAVLGKESAAPAVAAMPVVALIAASDRSRVFRDLVVLACVLGAIGVAYLLVRAGLGFGRPVTQEGRYELLFGINISKNLLTVAGSLAFFGNTAALIGERSRVAALGFVPALLALSVVGVSLIRHRRALFALIDTRALAACVVLGIAAVIAPSLAPSISEHNAALPSGPLLAALFALVIAAGAVSDRLVRGVAASAAALAIAFGAVSMRAKAVAAADVAHVVGTTRAAIAEQLRRKDKVVVCVTPSEGRMYSIYRLPADRWVQEEALLARYLHPGKTVDVEMRDDATGCDLSVPNFPPAFRP